ncbi:MAG: dihydroorotate oxidase [Chitinophagales bacterium]|jgi:dihydroorotate dehydrogenase (fumarate)|nr:dihydroorotate oxidase [Chitinophagales bacterium]
MNASGVHCTSAQEIQEVLNSDSLGAVSKSMTIEARQGNPKPRYWDDSKVSINSMGLPNHGLEYYLQAAQQIQKHDDQLFWLSVAGLNLEGNFDIFKKINSIQSIDAVELNLSCPNLPDHPIIAYNLPEFERMLKSVLDVSEKPVGVKLPPYFENAQFDSVAKILNQYPIDFITTINSIPNALVVDIASESTVITPKNGYGGIGGPFIKPTTLANINQFHLRLEDRIAIIGCGGIQNGSDVFEHILCGASAVQIGSQIAFEGLSCFQRIQNEFQQIVNQKKYSQISDFRGKLKRIAPQETPQPRFNY